MPKQTNRKPRGSSRYVCVLSEWNRENTVKEIGFIMAKRLPKGKWGSRTDAEIRSRCKNAANNNTTGLLIVWLEQTIRLYILGKFTAHHSAKCINRFDTGSCMLLLLSQKFNP